MDCRSVFGVDCDWSIEPLAGEHKLVPKKFPYYFEPQATRAILAALQFNKRLLISGMHGTGKSSHIEQICARLNWPCMRINLDGQISRLDLVGKDTLVSVDGKQLTQFEYGIIPWALSRPLVLVLDEYDAAKPEILFVLQRLLEQQGEFILPDGNTVLQPHKHFRLFATANTLGLGNMHNLYQGTNVLNQAQLDRWSLVVNLNFLSPEQELQIVALHSDLPSERLQQMIALANLTRQAFEMGDLSSLMSTRTVISWCENLAIFQDQQSALRLSFVNKCDYAERNIVAEFYQRVFDEELSLN